MTYYDINSYEEDRKVAGNLTEAQAVDFLKAKSSYLYCVTKYDTEVVDTYGPEILGQVSGEEFLADSGVAI